MTTAIAIIVCLAGLLIIAVKTVVTLQDDYHELGRVRHVERLKAKEVADGLSDRLWHVKQVLQMTLERSCRDTKAWADFRRNRWQKSDRGADLYSMQFLINRDNPVQISLRANGKQVTCRMPRDAAYDMIHDQFLEVASLVLNEDRS
ncbi:MAG: hypothetical protein ACYS7Y_04000 [Planctomycetota bacterium]|jgi:hypothetical protein